MREGNRRTVFSAVLLAPLAVLACGGLPDEPVPPPPMPAVGEVVPLPDDPAREFDFWLGEWSVANKHLKSDGSWKDTGAAMARIQPVAGGTAVLERWTGEVKGDPLIGFSLRAYDPSQGKWDVYLNWHGGKPVGFFLMHGERNGERMELFPPGDKTQIRYTFSEAREGSCQWDSAEYRNGLWFNDWVMQFTRTAPPQPADASGTEIEKPPTAAAKYPETRRLDGLLGVWEGRARRPSEDGTWDEGTARLRVTSMIEGFGLLAFLDTGWGGRTTSALGWDPTADGWVAVRADDRTPGLQRLAGSLDGETASFASREVRETWTLEAGGKVRFERSVADGNGAWQSRLVAELERSGGK